MDGDPKSVLAALVRAFQEARRDSRPTSDDLGREHKERSSVFLKKAHGLLNTHGLFKEDVVFSRHSRNREFKRAEYLFDIHVCSKWTRKSPNGRDVSVIKKSLLALESEFAEDFSQVMIDLSKLLCANADLKVMVASRTSDLAGWRDALGAAVGPSQGVIYFLFLPHPRDWLHEVTPEAEAYALHLGRWTRVLHQGE